MSKRFIIPFYALLLAILAGTPRLFSQQLTKAELSGNITDPSGASVPRVTVVATHTATKFTREALTNESGFYVISALPTGEYRLSAELPGFRKYVQGGINLGGGDRKVIDIRLEVGEVSNEIKVEATAPLVNRSDAILGVNLEQKTIDTLPINGRDFTALLVLQPGAVQGGAGAFPNASSNGSGSEAGDRVSISYNGAQDSWSSSNFTMDGVDISEIHFGLLGSNSISMESISEVVVNTSNYSAENGRSAAGKVNFVTKAGGNDFHGSLIEFYRGTRFQANDFFLNAAGKKLTGASRHQFGGGIGGPIKKDRLFFFVNYEGIRLDRPSSYNINALTKAFKSTLAPALRAYLDPVPEPTTINPNDPRVGTVSLTGGNTNENNVGLGRIDWNLGPRNQVFGRWNVDRQNNSNGATRGGYPQWPLVRENTMDNLGLTWNLLLNPTTTNEFSYGYQHRFNNLTQFSGFPAPACPACGKIDTPFWYREDVPNVLVTPQESHATFIHDNFRKVRGNHQLSAGIEWRKSYSTQGRLDQPPYTFLSLDDLAKNSPSTATNQWGYTPFAMGPAIQTDWGFFLQDDWKVNPRLTLNLGVRYDFVTANPDSNASPGSNPVWASSQQLGILNCKICTPGNFLVPGTQVTDSVNDKYFTRPGDTFRGGDYNNVGPRLGFALDLLGNGKTVLRGGYGIVYQPLEPATFGGQRSAVNALPNLNINRNDLPSLTFPTLDFKAAGGLKTLTFIDPDIGQGWTRQWNVSIQRQLGTNNMVQAAYVGNTTRVLSIFNPRYQLNPFIPDLSRPGGGYYVDPCCGAVDMRSAPTLAWYHALQITARRSVARGLALTGFYTWSHVISEYQDGQAGSFNFRKPDLTFPDGPGSSFYKLERSSGMSDVRQNFLTQILYDLPLGQNIVGRGWQLSGILSLNSGIAYDTPSSGFANRFRGTSRVDVVAGVPIYTGYVGPDKPYLNKAAFKVPAQDPQFPVDASGRMQVVFGNTERRMIYGPGFSNIDLGILKDTPIKEKQRLQLRVELFNLFNHVNWGAPGNIQLNFSAPNFGYILVPANSNRQVQFGIRYVF